MNASQRRVSDALDALTVAVEDETLPNGVVWSLGYLRAWMEERIMSERTTGATPEQVEAAAKRADESWGFGCGMPHVLGPEVRMAVPFIVQPDERIVKAADLRAVLDYMDAVGFSWTQEQGDAAARLREVLGDA